LLGWGDLQVFLVRIVKGGHLVYPSFNLDGWRF
ncbi:MAG: hypothetical protein JWQ31_126, partial [Mycobacterium sp.]|nr:hypothetical protein [Mycobacterium sp.]